MKQKSEITIRGTKRMLTRESTLRTADNAGAVLFKCLRIDGGSRRRYARINEMIGAISIKRRKYDTSLNKKFLNKKVKKKRKPKRKQLHKITVKPYEVLIVATRKSNQRLNGSTIRFDENRGLTFTEPTKFGPAGKSTMIPNFMGTAVFGPVCLELR
jgi:large subunit ribosomal protein L14